MTTMITGAFHAAAAAIKKRVERGKAGWTKVKVWWNTPRPDRGGPGIRFWAILAWQTWRGRDMLPLSRENRDPYEVHGLEHLPKTGVFTLAVNHTMRRWTPRLLSAVHHATMEIRPDLAREWIVIVGYREAKVEGKKWLARKVILNIRKVHTWIYRRWSYNALRLPMDNQKAGLQALRQWKTRAQKHPTVVFPEGRGYKTFEQVRPGAGRFLAGLGVPVLPVSVWWEEEANRWQIVFGPPVAWSADSRLHDLQVGLEIAYGLPPHEAPHWQKALKDWDAAYQSDDGGDMEGLPEETGEPASNLNVTPS